MITSGLTAAAGASVVRHAIVLRAAHCRRKLSTTVTSLAQPRQSGLVMAVANPADKLGLSLDAIIAQRSRSRPGGGRGFGSRGGAAHALSEFDSDAGEHREHQESAPSGGPAPASSSKVFVGNLSYQTDWQSLKDHFKAVGNVTYANVMREGPGDRARSKGCGIVEFASPADATSAITQLNESSLDGRAIIVREDRGGFVADDREGGAHAQRQQNGRRGDRGYDRREGGYMRSDGFSRERSPPPAPADMECYECGELGHRARDCPNRGQGGGRGFQRRSGSPWSGDGGSSQFPPRAGRQIVVHGLPYSFTWQELKDMANESGGAVKADISQDRNTGRSRGFGTVLFETPEQAEACIQAVSGSELDGRFVSAKMDEYA